MAKMIPSLLSPEIKSNAERKIFALFRDAPDTDDWVVLHSLGIANHRSLIYGEIDFVVLAPHYGIFALEVKGGRVSRTDGLWEYTDRYGAIHTKTRGPFEQASSGCFSLMDTIKKKYGGDSKLSRLFFASGVCFPDITFTLDEVDAHQWQVFDQRDGDNIKGYIHRMATNTHQAWEKKYGTYHEDKIPDRKDIKALAQFLRGDFDKAVSLASRIRTAEDELIQLTGEQLICLDQLDDNKRVLIEGSAGTGKTLIAIESAKKAALKGEKVAFFCFNTMLGSWLKSDFQTALPSLRPLYIGTFHDFIFEIALKAGIKLEKQDYTNQQFWKVEMPLAALEAAEKLSLAFDRIIIDEAQDLISENYLEVFDTILKGGIERGSWNIFGDFSQQAIYSGLSGNEMKSLLETRTGYVKYRLRVNCRNTRPIAEEIKALTGFDRQNNLLMKAEGPPVTYHQWNSIEEQKEKLEGIITDLLKKEKIDRGSITVLAPIRREHSVVLHCSIPISNYEIPALDKISFSTIQAYKGLENSIIILVDITSYEKGQLIYIGLSRARSSLIILESKEAHKERINKR